MFGNSAWIRNMKLFIVNKHVFYTIAAGRNACNTCAASRETAAAAFAELPSAPAAMMC